RRAPDTARRRPEGLRSPDLRPPDRPHRLRAGCTGTLDARRGVRPPPRATCSRSTRLRDRARGCPPTWYGRTPACYRDVMVKLVFCARRLPHLSRAEFQRYWREVHGPLVRQHAAVLRIRGYVQVHTLDDPLQEVLRAARGGPEAFDGVAELWWDSREDLMG